MFVNQEFPSFNGRKRDYYNFKRRWSEAVSVTSSGVNHHQELVFLKQNCPRSVQAYVKYLKSVKDLGCDG
jgi:hypothetical protein